MPALVILKSINAEYILFFYNRHIKITIKIIGINTAQFSPFDTFFVSFLNSITPYMKMGILHFSVDTF
jgi:hypothetical protein